MYCKMFCLFVLKFEKMLAAFYNIKVSFGKVTLRFLNVANRTVGMFDLVRLVTSRIFTSAARFVGF